MRLKKILLWMGGASATLLAVCLMAMQPESEDPQKRLYDAITAKDYRGAVEAIRTFKAKPTFLIATNGTRTVKQINALNFAIAYYADNQVHDDADELLRLILNPMTPKELEAILAFEDQLDNRTPVDIVSTRMPMFAQDVYSWLGCYIKKQRFNADEDELNYRRTGKR